MLKTYSALLSSILILSTVNKKELARLQQATTLNAAYILIAVTMIKQYNAYCNNVTPIETVLH